MERNGSLCHVEIQVSDLARAQQFYGAVFDWDFDAFMEDMVVFGQGESHIGGLMRVDQVDAGHSPSLWFKVENLDATLVAATQAGGTIESPRSPVPGVGFSASILDPDGTPIGIVEYAR